MADSIAPKGLNLPRYQPDKACVKCGGSDIGTRYVAGQPCTEKACRRCEQEHLRRACAVCGFAWAESPADREVIP